MAEYCLECWNRINATTDTEKRYMLSWDKELCECCAEYKQVIVRERLSWVVQKRVEAWVKSIKRN